ncbi:uncharacterized protein KY384_008215 [Bacidia gigantensis]|uniref:uncharacterized protein n=1 Tax=Bacidia gigantensis TaxID=2732470 RepID=UPI001D043777|nr:uncharacterized protein KY384_008215 [Bacidia gigantensis]KAG8526786.1 hypothetical protein KY384_008215 [Bacidia gigantensis]
MPGILPMKVIKVGSNAQSRIAQACDRCRSKKIRCDGTTPCCTQCANVGFKCKTSDKLSRRAFPRGYTESLEERVRALESEVQELKDLLDAKDEKIDMLSRIHAHSPILHRPSSTFSNSTNATSLTSFEDAIHPKVEASDSQDSEVSPDEASQTTCSAADSNGSSFVDEFKAKTQECDKECPTFKTQVFFNSSTQRTPNSKHHPGGGPKVLSRMESDRMVNTFFQEWSPLFPILDRQAVLEIYENYLTDPDEMKSQQSIALLNLLFGIASLSTEDDTIAFEVHWQPALEAIIKDISIPTLQCVMLAIIHCIAKRDYEKLPRYRASAVKLSRRLGLHQSQKRSSLSESITETRKQLFWTLYVLDSFSASLLGQSQSFEDGDITCEYPEGDEDGNAEVSTPLSLKSGETPRLSRAPVIVGGARMLSRVLDEMYPVDAPRRLSLQTISALSGDLDKWWAEVPSHLKLEFVQDKPCTNIVGSRSPFITLAYHYIRTLIHRPLASCSICNHRSSSIVALGSSSKRIVQIVELLEERRLSFSFCLNKNHIMTMAGFGLLFQTLDFDRQGKLHQDSGRLLRSVVSTLDRNKAPGAAEFKKVVTATTKIDLEVKPAKPFVINRNQRPKSNGDMPAPKRKTKNLQRSHGSEGMIFHNTTTSPPIKPEVKDSRRFSTTSLPIYDRNFNYPSMLNLGPDFLYTHPRPENVMGSHLRRPSESLPNLDYLDFNNEPQTSSQTSTGNTPKNCATTPMNSIHDFEQPQAAPYLQPPQQDVFSYLSELPPSISEVPRSKPFEWCDDIWKTSLDMNVPGATSFTEEELTSGEELSSCGASGHFAFGASPQEHGFTGEDDLHATLGLGI